MKPKKESQRRMKRSKSYGNLIFVGVLTFMYVLTFLQLNFLKDRMSISTKEN